MITLLKLGLLAIVLFAVILVISKIVKYDGTKYCSGECESCPFPPCDKERNI